MSFWRRALDGRPHAAQQSIENLATELLRLRSDICVTANAIPLSVWSDRSTLGEWTYKDVLAHCAISRWLLHTFLMGVSVRGSRDLKRLPSGPVVDAATSVLHDEWRARGIEELVRKVEAEGRETQRLIALALGESTVANNAIRSMTGCLSDAVCQDRECLRVLLAAPH